MKMKIIFALCVFVGLAAMEGKKCEITFDNDLEKLVTIHGLSVKPSQQLKLIVPSGKSFAVYMASGYAPYIDSGYSSLRSLPVPIIRDDNKSTSCVAALSFLINAKENSTCEAPDNSNIYFYFSRIP